jgi:hypothetical protein
VFKDDAQAQDAFDALSKGMARAPDCIQTLFPPLGKDFKLGKVEVSKLRVKPRGVDEARAWQIVIPIRVLAGAQQGDLESAYIDLVYLREADVLARMKTFHPLFAFDSELRTKLLQAVASRMSE